MVTVSWLEDVGFRGSRDGSMFSALEAVSENC